MRPHSERLSHFDDYERHPPMKAHSFHNELSSNGRDWTKRDRYINRITTYVGALMIPTWASV